MTLHFFQDRSLLRRKFSSISPNQGDISMHTKLRETPSFDKSCRFASKDRAWQKGKNRSTFVIEACAGCHLLSLDTCSRASWPHVVDSRLTNSPCDCIWRSIPMHMSRSISVTDWSIKRNICAVEEASDDSNIPWNASSYLL